jgi:hypothetical protein
LIDTDKGLELEEAQPRAQTVVDDDRCSVLIGIQNACQIAEGKSGSKINRFSATPNQPDDAPLE